jgi:hypothetical protein
VNQLSQLSGTELEELSIRIYHATVKFYDQASAIFSEMLAIPTWTPVYDDMRAQAGVLIAAGREQKQLHDELVGFIRSSR